MNRSRLFAGLAAVGAAAALSGCGGDDGGSDSAAAPAAEVQQGGTFTGYFSSFPDYLDPALSYTADGWSTMWPVYTGLLTYRHAEGADGAELVPGLAEDMPEISDDGLTYTLKLRSGLTYSDGTPVKASDFEHTVKRILNLESGGSFFYQSIEGATEYLEAGKENGDISGIETDDQTGDITIKLAQPDGQFQYYLAMNFAGLVPEDTPFENQTDDPAPGVGPYVLSDVQAGRGWKLVRNDRFTALPNVPEGKADEIDMSVVKNARRQVQDVLGNKVDFIFDAPPADQLRQVKQQAADRYSEEITNSTYYFFLNHRTAPFDDEKVRQAVGLAVDERALQRIFAGLLQPTCNFLPPGMDGYVKIQPCPFGEPGSEPDLARAKQLITEAGAEGEKVTVWGNTDDPSRPVTEYLADVMNQIGLDAKPRILDGSAYFQTVGNQKTKAQAGFANWFQDFPHPANFMFLVNGDSIQSTNNQNFGNVDDPQIDKLIDDAGKNPELNAVADEYAQADKLLAERAHVIPYGNRKLTKVTSDRVAFDQLLWHPVYQYDFTTLGGKAGAGSSAGAQ